MATQGPHVLVLGFGGVGALYAYVLQKGGASITAVCRSNYETVKEKGIDVVSEKYGTHRQWRPDHVVRSPEEVNDVPFDYVVCTFKCVPEVRPSSATIRPFLEKNLSFPPKKLPLVVLIQNGVGIEQEVYDSLVTSKTPLASGVVSGLTWVGVTLLGEGTRIEHGLMERLKIGLYPPPLDEAPPKELGEDIDRLVQLFAKGDSEVEASNDIVSVRWSKVLWNISWGGVSTLARQPVSIMLQAEMLPYTCGVVRGIMLELLAIARADGIEEKRLPAGTVDYVYELTFKSSRAKIRLSKNPDEFYETGQATYLPDDFKPSILVDLERQRPMELDSIFGNLISIARKKNVDTPRLDLIVTALKPSQLEFVRASKGNPEPNTSAPDYNVYDANPSLNKTGGAPVLSHASLPLLPPIHAMAPRPTFVDYLHRATVLGLVGVAAWGIWLTGAVYVSRLGHTERNGERETLTDVARRLLIKGEEGKVETTESDPTKKV